MKLRLNLCAVDVDVYVSLVVRLRALLEAIWTPRIMNLTQWRSQSFSSVWELFRCFISLYPTSSACTYNSWHNQQSMYEDENMQIQILQICGKEFFSSMPMTLQKQNIYWRNTCSKSTIETPEQCMKFDRNYQLKH